MSPNRRRPGLRVLVVEDSVDESFLIRSILESRGHRVQTAQDGGRALALWDGGTFDVVVTDLNLPGMDGVALTAALNEPGRDAGVIAVTGYTDSKHVHAARRAGAAHVLPKPIDPHALIEWVERAAERSRAPGPVSVLVVGARSGDATFGCGGTLVRHRTAGHRVVVVVLDPEVPGTATASCTREAARILDVDLRFADDRSMPRGDPTGTIRRLVEEVSPDVAFAPSEADDDRTRREAHRAAMPALHDVPEVLGYLSPTSTLDFLPDILKVVTPQMSMKLDAVLAFAELRDPALTGRFVSASARWWGRSIGFAEVEPFEQLTP